MKEQRETRPSDAVTAPESMGLGDEHFEDGTDLGAIRIHNNVISIIARVAALKIDGVVDMSSGIVEGLAGIFGKKPQDRGIRVEVSDRDVNIDLLVILAYGVRIPETCWQIQTDVREAVERMTGKSVRAVNVFVQSVREPIGEAPGDRPK